MIGAVHKYYRKISENLDNIKNSIDIASLLVKSQEVDLKIKDIENNNNENLTLIQTKIDNIENDIDSKFYSKKYLDNELNNYYYKSNIDNKISNMYDNYYDKNHLNLQFNNLYNRTYLDNKFDDIYDKTEINSINSKLNRNIILFNTNLTNHVDDYKIDKKIIDENIKENKNKLDNFVINTFSNFSTNISNLNNTQNNRLDQLENNKLTDIQKNKIVLLENIDLGKINSSYNFSVFNKNRVDKIRYYIKEFIPFNITLIKKFTFIGNMNELLILQFELDQREFSIDDILDYSINVNFQYDNSKSNWYRLKMRFDILYDDDSLISS